MIPAVSGDRAVVSHEIDYHRAILVSMEFGSGKLSDFHIEILLRETETHLSIGSLLKYGPLLLGWTVCSLSGLVLTQGTPCTLVLPYPV